MFLRWRTWLRSNWQHQHREAKSTTSDFVGYSKRRVLPYCRILMPPAIPVEQAHACACHQMLTLRSNFIHHVAIVDNSLYIHNEHTPTHQTPCKSEQESSHPRRRLLPNPLSLSVPVAEMVRNRSCRRGACRASRTFASWYATISMLYNSY